MPESVSKPTLLCVDDEQSILKALQRVFASQDYELLLSTSGADALKIMAQKPVHVIISDMRMPQMSGAEFLAEAAKLQPDAYRVLMTGYADLSSTISAINVGRIHRYIQKPWENQQLLETVHDGLQFYRLIRNNKLLTAKVAQQNKHLKELNHNLEEIVQQRTEQLKKTLTQLKLKVAALDKEQKAQMEVLYNIISVNPHLSGEFALKVARSCKELAKQLGMSKEESQFCYSVGLFSEVGKLGLPVNLLQKPFTELDNHERTLYLQHPIMAEQILAPATHLEDLTQALLQQYERFNGTGEPEQRVGIDIMPAARILAVARDFWALVYQRSTPKKHSVAESLEAIKRLRGSYYDPEVVDALNKLNQAGLQAEQHAQLDGLTVQELQPGMQIKSNLYNSRKILLLPRGHIFNQHSIEKIRQYQRKHNEILRIQIVENAGKHNKNAEEE